MAPELEVRDTLDETLAHLDGIAAPVDQQMDALEDRIVSELAPVEMTLRHEWTPGIYTRIIFMPATTLLTSKVHKTQHPYFVLAGVAEVFTEDGGRQILAAPRFGVTQPDTRRALYIHEDCLWATVHAITPEEEAEPDEVKRLAMIEARIMEVRRPEVRREHQVLLARARAAILGEEAG